MSDVSSTDEFPPVLHQGTVRGKPLGQRMNVPVQQHDPRPAEDNEGDWRIVGDRARSGAQDWRSGRGDRGGRGARGAGGDRGGRGDRGARGGLGGRGRGGDMFGGRGRASRKPLSPLPKGVSRAGAEAGETWFVGKGLPQFQQEVPVIEPVVQVEAIAADVFPIPSASYTFDPSLPIRLSFSNAAEMCLDDLRKAVQSHYAEESDSVHAAPWLRRIPEVPQKLEYVSRDSMDCLLVAFSSKIQELQWALEETELEIPRGFFTFITNQMTEFEKAAKEVKMYVRQMEPRVLTASGSEAGTLDEVWHEDVAKEGDHEEEISPEPVDVATKIAEYIAASEQARSKARDAQLTMATTNPSEYLDLLNSLKSLDKDVVRRYNKQQPIRDSAPKLVADYIEARLQHYNDKNDENQANFWSHIADRIKGCIVEDVLYLSESQRLYNLTADEQELLDLQYSRIVLHGAETSIFGKWVARNDTSECLDYPRFSLYLKRREVWNTLMISGNCQQEFEQLAPIEQIVLDKVRYTATQDPLTCWIELAKLQRSAMKTKGLEKYVPAIKHLLSYPSSIISDDISVLKVIAIQKSSRKYAEETLVAYAAMYLNNIFGEQ